MAKTLADSLNLRGRILISKHGINGTVGGDIDDVKKYIKATKQFPGFKNTVFKWSDGSREDFPRMSVKVRDEIVAFEAGDELRVDENGVIGGGIHLKPKQVHELVASRDDVVFLMAAMLTRRPLVSLKMPSFLIRTPAGILFPSWKAASMMT